MKSFRRFAVACVAVIIGGAIAASAQKPTIEELQAVKELLPITPEEIDALVTTFEEKDKTFNFEAKNYSPVLTPKEKARLQKKGVVVLRIVAELAITDNKETDPKKRVKQHDSGSADIYVIDAQENKLVSRKKERLSKLCPG